MWFTGPTGVIGVVLTKNEVGQNKAYLGSVMGKDEDYDTNYICKYGTKIHPSQAKAIYEHLNQ